MGRRRRSKPAARGIAPNLLREQVRSTVPFVFADDFTPRDDEPHLSTVRGADEPALDSADYYRLCLSAHHSTVTSFVPTDVDVAIRWKLWRAMSKEQSARALDVVMESLVWSSSRVSTRTLYGELGPLSGHHGEWFSTAAAAYGEAKRRHPERVEEIGEALVAEVRREARWFDAARAGDDGLLVLKVATSIAHNLGDLDRVIEQWSCEEDPVCATVYRAGHAPTPGLEALHAAGELNKALMAIENHRHYALRKPRCLRADPALLLPIAPFFDDWGRAVGQRLRADEVAEVVVALLEGFDRGRGAIGYARALRGIEESVPGGQSALVRSLPTRKAKALRTGALRTAMNEPQARFETRMANAAWKALRS